MTDLNKEQVGGDHYKKRGSVSVKDIVAYADRLGVDSIQHWDLAVLFAWDPYQYQITKYVMRWKDKDGLKDLQKGHHFLTKYTAVVAADALPMAWGANRPVTVDFDKATQEEIQKLAEGMRHLPGTLMVLRDPPALRDIDFTDLINPSAWIGFTLEGIDAGGALYTCSQCHEKFRVQAGRAPSAFHKCKTTAETFADGIKAVNAAADANGAYVAQDREPGS